MADKKEIKQRNKSKIIQNETKVEAKNKIKSPKARTIMQQVCQDHSTPDFHPIIVKPEKTDYGVFLYDTLDKYIKSINTYYQSGIATEHSYRGDFATLFKAINPKLYITNEPSDVADCGNPDFVITNQEIPIGFIEAKDIGKDLNSKGFDEQLTRYRNALDNLIITDYLYFQFFKHGNLEYEIKIAEIVNGKIIPLPENFDQFVNLIHDFSKYACETIKSSKVLAKMMANKARLLESIIYNALVHDDAEDDNTTELQQQFKAFKEFLINDLTTSTFSDIYAQTLAYGMFAARLHDKTLDTFSRKKAAELIPKSNPFLRKLFNHIAGVDIDPRLIMTVDNLANVFRATDIEKLLKHFGKSIQATDPMIHFYETFLNEYDPQLKIELGVFYTPAPVVNFIVRSVDKILKNKFDLKDGLAETSKTTIKIKSQRVDNRKKTKLRDQYIKVHKVQVLDPAVGTGTFLAEIVKFIYQKFSSMKGAWRTYVSEHLIPRLNGFELMMAPYAIAHLKLDMLLTETGYRPDSNKRFNIFLTNSLEEHHPDTGTLWSSWLSDEANEANHIKRDSAVMVILGNPPYNPKSKNNKEWILNLMKDYKKEPGGKVKLNERNSKGLNDDYVKFLRYGQHFIERNGEGILAFINPHGFLNNPTFRGMRWHLLKTYDEIYTIDLHGNSLRQERCPDGSTDKNIFEIQQGVSINFFIKTGMKNKGELGKIFHNEIYGLRELKNDFLWDNDIDSIDFQELPKIAPDYFFVPRKGNEINEYKKGFSIKSLFPINSTGLVTAKDDFIMDTDLKQLIKRIKYFCKEDDIKILNDKFHTLDKKGNRKNWVTHDIKKTVGQFSKNLIEKISYRPFDNRYIYYDHALLDRSRRNLMKHLIGGDNIALICSRTNKKFGTCDHFFISNCLVELKCGESSTNCSAFPLYIKSDLYTKVPNFNQEIINIITTKSGLMLNGSGKKSYSPEDLLSYIYAVLYSNNYRKKYSEYLKSDFPFIPYPSDIKLFKSLVSLGTELMQLHLFDHENIKHCMSKYPIPGNDTITMNINKNDWELYDEKNKLIRIFINDKQYFDEIPKAVWLFGIGGYTPAQKWLKSRHGKKLNHYDQILEYQKMIFALSETIRLMSEIDDLI